MSRQHLYLIFWSLDSDRACCFTIVHSYLWLWGAGSMAPNVHNCQIFSVSVCVPEELGTMPDCHKLIDKSSDSVARRENAALNRPKTQDRRLTMSNQESEVLPVAKLKPCGEPSCRRRTVHPSGLCLAHQGTDKLVPRFLDRESVRIERAFIEEY